MRGFRETAKAYVLAAKTTGPIAGEIAALREQNENQSREIDELKELVRSLAADKGIAITDEVKRGPGRPKKAA
jgi:hypothetical protein